MIERNPALVVVLMLVTCGFYSFYYLYATTQELVAATGRTDINPTTELLLNVITCGLFGMYSEYRNQQLIDAWYQARGLQHEPKAQMVGLMNLLALVFGVTWMVATFIYQDEQNKMLAAQAGAGAPQPAPMTF